MIDTFDDRDGSTRSDIWNCACLCRVPQEKGITIVKAVLTGLKATVDSMRCAGEWAVL
jgi:hypothetical protein